MAEITIEGRNYECHALAPADRIRYARLTNRLIEAAEHASISILLLMVGVENPPHVDDQNARDIFTALKPLLSNEETTLTGQAAADKLREAQAHREGSD